MKRIAVIGLGIMGHGLADNYLKKDYQLYVWNRTKEKANDLVARGAVFCPTPAEAAKQADVVFEVTANDESSRQVWLGEDSILSADMGKTRPVLITCATLSIAWVDALARKCQEANTQNIFFDMPMTGGRAGAENGELTLLVGGDEQELNSLKPDLDPIAKDVKYFGKAGMGARYELILNMLQAIHIAGLGEALKLANKVGLDENRVGAALAERPGGATTNLAWSGYQNEPTPINFSIEWIRKDLEYAKKMADGVSSPLLDDVLTQYRQAMEDGFAQSDWTKVTKL